MPRTHAFNIDPSAAEVGEIIDQKSSADAMSQEVYSGYSSSVQMAVFVCRIGGCSKNPKSTFFYKHSALAMMGNAMGTLYANPPADFAYWLRDTGETLGFVPKHVNAQGIGFTGLSPLLPVWKAFRNIAYLLLSLSMVVIGFMVMFRKKIDPKTVVTVQNSLPRIVITMLLVTFSYAIVGFMIDLMYLFIAFISVVMQSGFTGVSDTVANLTNGGFTAFITSIFAPVGAMNQPATQVWPNVLKGQLGDAFTNLIGAIGFTLFGGLLLQIIIGIAFLFAFIRILFMLLNSYVQILLSVIVGPLQILLDVFPGGNGFGMWITNLFTNLIAFPITVFMLILGNILYQNFGKGLLWVPPLLPQPTNLPVVGQVGGVGGLALSLITLGIILSIPTIVDSIKEALKAKAAVPGGVGAVFGPIGGGVGQLFQYGYQASFIKSAFRSGPGGHQENEFVTATKAHQSPLSEVTGQSHP